MNLIAPAAPPLAPSNMAVFFDLRTPRASSDIAARTAESAFPQPHLHPLTSKNADVSIA